MVPPDSGQSAYRSAGRPARTARTGPYRSPIVMGKQKPISTKQVNKPMEFSMSRRPFQNRTGVENGTHMKLTTV
ncbi:hypothetical protein GW17_00024118 [Ensete ventricosum]|nr:hypothetical protein GW17_00024118 [Ensete ventricosum]